MNEVIAGFKTVNDLCLRVNMNISVVIFEPFLNKKTWSQCGIAILHNYFLILVIFRSKETTNFMRKIQDS